MRNLIFIWFVLRHFRKVIVKLRGRGLIGTAIDGYLALQRFCYGLFLNAPGVRGRVKLQVDEALKKLEDKMVPKGPGVTRHIALPKEGLTDEAIKEELKT